MKAKLLKQLFPLPDGTAITVNDTVRDTVRDTINDTVKQRMKRIIQELIKQPGFKSKDLAKIIGVLEASIRRDTQQLTQLAEFKSARKTSGYFLTDYMLSKLKGG